MAFSPRSDWSELTQGYSGTTRPVKDCTPGSSPEKSTVVLGGGWRYDKAEAARLAREEELLYSVGGDGPTRMTEQGERRAKEAQDKPPPFSARPSKLTPGEKKKKPVTRSDTRKATEEASAAAAAAAAATSTRRGRRRPSSPEPFPEGRWNPKTQGYDGYYNWRLGK